jgi:hypothetical protein
VQVEGTICTFEIRDRLHAAHLQVLRSGPPGWDLLPSASQGDPVAGRDVRG